MAQALTAMPAWRIGLFLAVCRRRSWGPRPLTTDRIRINADLPFRRGSLSSVVATTFPFINEENGLRVWDYRCQ